MTHENRKADLDEIDKLKKQNLKRCSLCKNILPRTEEYFAPRRQRNSFVSRCKQCTRKRPIKKEGCKVCHQCKEEKLVSDFYKNRARDDGLDTKCKPCRLKANREYELTTSGKEARKRHTIKYTHSEVGKLYNAKQSHKRRSTQGSFTENDIKNKYREQNGKCYWCAKKLKGEYEIDHIHPLSLGGTNWPDNLCLSCQFCNRSKGNKTLLEFGRLL